ncbi:hypothetical protein [Azospirillum sp.]|uniref:hypothetical protein n=1 Tax=Azospirillum sp. TaxID=34012 RepID=UPI003D7397EA
MSDPREILADALHRANQGSYKTRREPGGWSPEACAVWREGGETQRLLYAALVFELKFRRHARASDTERIVALADEIDAGCAAARAQAERGEGG